MTYDNTNRGVFFTNNRKKTDKHPDMTGKINVNGVDYELSGWKKQGKNGEFISLGIKPAYNPQQRSERPENHIDDEIGF